MHRGPADNGGMSDRGREKGKGDWMDMGGISSWKGSMEVVDPTPALPRASQPVLRVPPTCVGLKSDTSQPCLGPPPLWDQSGSPVSHSMGLATDAPSACPTRAPRHSALSYVWKWVINQQGATRWASPTVLLCFCPMFPLRACSLAGGPFLSLPVARWGFGIGMLHSRHHLHPSVGFPGGEPCSRCRS